MYEDVVRYVTGSLGMNEESFTRPTAGPYLRWAIVMGPPTRLKQVLLQGLIQKGLEASHVGAWSRCVGRLHRSGLCRSLPRFLYMQMC